MNFQLHLDDETVDQAFPYDPLCVAPSASVREVFHLLKENRRGCVLVCEGERLVGIFTERDALHLMVNGGDLDRPIQELMRRQVTTLSARDVVGTAIAKMAHGGYRRLPIVDDQGKPTGLLSSKSILHYLVEHFPTVVYTLPPEPHHSTQTREGA